MIQFYTFSPAGGPWVVCIIRIFFLIITIIFNIVKQISRFHMNKYVYTYPVIRMYGYSSGLANVTHV